MAFRQRLIEEFDPLFFMHSGYEMRTGRFHRNHGFHHPPKTYLIRSLISGSLLIPMLQPCFGHEQFLGNKGLSEVQAMKGAKVVVSEDKELISGMHLQRHNISYVQTENLAAVYIALLPTNDLLGKGLLPKDHQKLWWALGVELHLQDEAGRILSVNPIHVLADSPLDGIGPLRGTGFDRGTLIYFIIDKRLMPYSFLRFIERASGLRQWTDVYLGPEPRPLKVPEPIFEKPTSPVDPRDLIPGLEPLPRSEANAK